MGEGWDHSTGAGHVRNRRPRCERGNLKQVEHGLRNGAEVVRVVLAFEGRSGRGVCCTDSFRAKFGRGT